MTASVPATSNSPFMTIPPVWRQMLIVYMLLYQILFPVIVAFSQADAEVLLLPRFFLKAVHVLLVCWPLFFYRREYGFLHPLILPTILLIFEDVVKFPLHLVAPFAVPLVDYAVPTTSSAISLRIGLDELAQTRFWYEAMQILALVSYYAGYFAFKFFKVPNLTLHAPRNLSRTCLLATMLCVGVGFAFIQFGGGLASHLVAMRGGRAALFDSQGQFLMIGEFSILVVLVWFVYLRSPFTNVLWLGALAAAAFTTIVVAGSRSSLVYAMAALLLLWWRRENKVLILPSAALGLAAVLVFAIFGSIRQDWNSRTVDTSVFDLSHFSGNLERAQAEFERRMDQEGDLAAFAGAGNGLLWGRSYLGAISFWVPRAIWKDKPHGAGAYNMWTNFAGKRLEQFGTGVYWGIPVGTATEAYWNFHLPGVVVIYLLFGAFHRWLSALVWRYPHSPIVLVFSIWVITHFVGDSSTFVRTVRDVFLLAILSYALGILRSGGGRKLMSLNRRFGWPANAAVAESPVRASDANG